MQKIPVIIIYLLSFPVFAQLEFQHWWTSGGESAALEVLLSHLEEHDIEVDASPIEGGGGNSSLMVLQARALAGNTPHLAQIEGASIKAWGAIGILHSIDSIAQKQQWETTLIPLAKKFNKTQDGYVALPITLHKMNWLWSNQSLLSQLDLKVPSSWEQLISTMQVAKSRGITPLAIGKQPWQIAQLFEHISIATGGAEFYRQALVELNPVALKSPEMEKTVQHFRKLSSVTGYSLPDKHWDELTNMLVNDQALFQIGGDWILGELLYRGIKVPDKIHCSPTPGTEKVFVYNMDSIMFMDRWDFPQSQALQLAEILSQPSFQKVFNMRKGAIPVHSNISLEGFNQCQIDSSRYLKEAIAANTAVPSMIDSMAINPIKQNAITNELFRFFINPNLDENLLIKRLVAIAESS